MILDLDPTSLKYAPCSRKTLAAKNSKHVAISGTSNKKATTRTFVITLDGQCLSFQPIYRGQNYEKFAKIQNPKTVFIERKQKTFQQHSRVS